MNKSFKAKKTKVSVEINPEIEGEGKDTNEKGKKRMRTKDFGQTSVQEEMVSEELADHKITAKTSNRTLGQLKGRKDKVGAAAREEIRRRRPMSKHAAAKVLRKHLRGDETVGLHAAHAAAIVGPRKAAHILKKIVTAHSNKVSQKKHKTKVAASRHQKKAKAIVVKKLSANAKTIESWRAGIGLSGQGSIEKARNTLVTNPPPPEVASAIHDHFRKNELKLRRQAFGVDKEISDLEKRSTRIGTKVHDEKNMKMRQLRDQFHLDHMHMAPHFHDQVEMAKIGHDNPKYVKTRFAKILNSPTYQVMALHHEHIAGAQKTVQRPISNEANRKHQNDRFGYQDPDGRKWASSQFYIRDHQTKKISKVGDIHKLLPHQDYLSKEELDKHLPHLKAQEAERIAKQRAEIKVAAADHEAAMPWWAHPDRQGTGVAVAGELTDLIKLKVKGILGRRNKKGLKESTRNRFSEGIKETEFQSLVRIINEKH